MSDEDPKSLLVLCDDTIRYMLSFMPLKSRVKHSRTCRVLGYVVDQQLLSVKSLTRDECDAMSLLTDEPHFKSRMKTLWKLKNLTSVMTASRADDEGRDEVISVIVENCHYIRRLWLWDMECVFLYVSGLIGKGIPVRVKIMENFDAEDKELAMKVLQETKLKLEIGSYDLPFLEQNGCSDRVIYVEIVGNCYSIPLHSMASVEKITRLVFEEGEENMVQRVLHSMPRLQEIDVTIWGNGDKLFKVLAEADQEFKGIELDVEYSLSGKEGVDHFKQMLEAKGRKLRFLDLMIRESSKETVVHVLDLIRKNCSRLRFFFYLKAETDESWDQQIRYHDDKLIINFWTGVPLKLLFPIIPNIRIVHIDNSFLIEDQVPEEIMHELRDFASGKKEHCIIIEIGDSNKAFQKTISSYFDQNLLVNRLAEKLVEK